MTPPNERQAWAHLATDDAAVHGMISAVRHYLQKSLYGVTTLQECGPNFFLVKLEWKLVFKVPILVTFDAAV